MLKDDDFAQKAAVDRYGRRLNGEAGRKELEKFYDFGQEEEIKKGDGKGRGLSLSNDEIEDDEVVMKELRRVEQKYDPARDGGFSTSSDDSSSEEDSEQEVDVEEEVFGFPDQHAGNGLDVPMGEVTSRIAVVNLDWDNIRAVDLMAVFTSFCPASGQILKVSVYPSEFGKERMEREEIEGPPKEIFASQKPPEAEEVDEDASDDDEDEDERIKRSLLQADTGEEFNSAKLRRYQLERLRYYYAILTLSSASTAKALYEATDGTEYLTTANFFDLRFVPDDTDFTTDRSRDSCSKIPDGYRPNNFVTDALQHSKVRLTWDADDAVRKESVKRAFTGSRQAVDENDLKAYLGSDSSDQSEEEDSRDGTENATPGSKSTKKEASRLRLRSAFGLTDNATSKAATGSVGDMEITFTSGFSAKDSNGSVFTNGPVIQETTVEKYVRKEKERKQRRKEKAKAAREGEDRSMSQDEEPNMKDTEEDLGFEDPFFTSTDLATQVSKPSKEDQKARRASQEAAAAAATAERAELELLMNDDIDASATGGSKQAHFDINAVLKAEKAEKGKKKKKRFGKDKKSVDMEAAQDGFEMNVKDPRFSDLFENHEFAIDPTNPRFKGTKGMKALLEEGRKKRKMGTDGEDEGFTPKRKAVS